MSSARKFLRVNSHLGFVLLLLLLTQSCATYYAQHAKFHQLFLANKWEEGDFVSFNVTIDDVSQLMKGKVLRVSDNNNVDIFVNTTKGRRIFKNINGQELKPSSNASFPSNHQLISNNHNLPRNYHVHMPTWIVLFATYYYMFLVLYG